MEMDYELCDSGGVICPYCKAEDHWTGDPIGDDDASTTTECSSCGKEFEVRVSITVDHHCYKLEENNTSA